MALDEACTEEESTDTGRRWRPRAPGWAVNAADTLSPTFAPFAARWDTESGRRRQLRTPENLKALMDAAKAHNSARSVVAKAANQRTAAGKASSNPLSAERRAARTALKAAQQHQKKAKAALSIARSEYPATLLRRAVQAHSVHAVPAALSSWLMPSVWPATASAALVGLHMAALRLGRRNVSATVDDDMSAEERQLVARLDPSFWVEHAGERGLAGTVSTPAKLVSAGLECEVRLDGTWTVKSLRDKTDSVRALLGARTELPIVVVASSRGGWAVIRLRTRSAAPGGVIVWRPGDSFGVDMITGEDVSVSLGHRMLVAGMSGSGKSTASRPLLYDASQGPLNVLVVIDLKMVEGRLWDHRARVAFQPEDVVDLVTELVEELNDRLASLPKGQATLIPTESRPRITIVVDEGAEVMSSCDKVETIVGYTDKDVPITEKVSALTGLDSIARMGRAACMDLWWMTQSPTYNDGVPRQIAKQLGLRIGLAVESPAEARVVFGESAQDKGWKADELPMPGVSMVRDGKRGPNPVKVRYMDDDAVVTLPAMRIWRRGSASPDPERRPLHLVKEPAAPTAGNLPGSAAEVHAQMLASETNRARVESAVKDGARTGKDIAEATGLHKGTVSREVKALVDSGALVRDGDELAVAGAR